MKKRKSTKPIFKTYVQNQALLLPPSLDELIDARHPVRLVNQIIDQLDLDVLERTYKGGGSSSFHPKMMLKVVVYAYLTNIYSSRKIQAALKENIHFMWLSGMNQPDHNTLNRFRTQRLQGPLKQIFKQVVLLLAEQGLVDVTVAYVDGTKVEANANRYTFVWAKSVRNYKERIEKEFDQLWNYAQQVAHEELADTAPLDFAQIDAQKVQQTIERIDQALKDKPVEESVKKKIKHAKAKWATQLGEYQRHEQTLQGRGSYSKTDPDATFMRTKDDHLQNGQLKPCYNVQLSTNNQVVTHYSIHQTSSDTVTLASHISEQVQSQLTTYPLQVVCADAGYGSEENYQLLAEAQIQACVKYPGFYQEQCGRVGNPFDQKYLYYNPEQDCLYCPMGQPMTRVGTEQRRSSTGFVQTYQIYQAQRCQGCPLRGVCHDGQGQRRVQVNHRLGTYKAKAKEHLLSPQGQYHSKKRGWDVETVFGQIKANKGFTRFRLRGKAKVETEIGLLALAHNMKKVCQIRPIYT